jgi:hypothetical protein
VLSRWFCLVVYRCLLQYSRLWVAWFAFVMFALAVGSWIWCWALWKGYQKLLRNGAFNKK